MLLQSLDRHQRESGQGFAMESALNRAQAKAMGEQTLFDSTAAFDQLGQASR